MSYYEEIKKEYMSRPWEPERWTISGATHLQYNHRELGWVTVYRGSHTSSCGQVMNSLKDDVDRKFGMFHRCPTCDLELEDWQLRRISWFSFPEGTREWFRKVDYRWLD